MLTGITIVLGCAAIGLLVALYLERRSRFGRRRPEDESHIPREYISSVESRGGNSFSQRPRTLKTCPDCRELVFLDATVCKHCGCALDVPLAKKT